MAPEARRRQIIDTTRRLVIERSGTPISTADVAAAAGVTRALVHHYFGGIEEIRQAVALDIADGTAEILSSGTETPVADRVRRNINALLDVIDANRHVWLTMLSAEGEATADTPAARHVRETVMEQMLVNNADVIDDTPWTRLCLSGFIGFSDAICKQWVLGETTRTRVEQALVQTLLRLLLEVIPEGSG